jgi:DNA replication and repair protein RecF
MFIKEIQLKNFRNYADSTLTIDKGVNVIIGYNAAGKTNLLEAIYFLENGKSHRVTSGTEIIKWNKDFAFVHATVNRRNREILLESSIKKNGTKQVKINGVIQTPAQARYKPVITVLFTPDHLKIIKETPEHRRAYLDDILEKIKPDYQYWRQQYSKIIKQRNVLLKRVSMGSMKKDIIDYWDTQLIQAGVKLVIARAELIERIQKSTGEAYISISQSDELLTLYYENQLLKNIDNSERSLNEVYAELLIQNRAQEIERGQTLVGPHRDDVIMHIGDMDVRTYGSQGEQRSVSLALKLGELTLVNEVVQDKPVLLLDDVMSELDEVRRHAFLAHISEEQQVIITSANENYLDDMKNLPLKTIRIKNGKIR